MGLLGRPTHFMHLTDAPLHVGDGGSVIGHRFVCGGARYGRFLFTDHCALVVDGPDAFIANCEFVIYA